MEEMNNITEMVNDTNLEVPALGTEAEGSKASVIGTIAGVGTVILVWEGAKFVAKKAGKVFKKVFNKKAQAPEQSVEGTAEEAEDIIVQD